MLRVRATPLPIPPDPLAAFDALRHEPGAALLWSGPPDGLSIVAARPFRRLETRGRRLLLDGHERDGDPFDALRELLAGHAAPPDPSLPAFPGGAIGFLSYDLGREVERLPTRALDDLDTPDLRLGLYSWALLFEGQRATLVTAEGAGLPAPPGAADLALRLARRPPPPEPPRLGPLASNLDRAAYEARVRRAQEYIRAGDIFQVCLAQRFEASWSGDPWALFLRLAATNPAPFAAFLPDRDLTVLSASPERFLRLTPDGAIETRPIKGTAPRGAGPEADAAQAARLRASAKDRAENAMIVDLLRNDLGRVSTPGSVRVAAFAELEAHPTVHHLVSTVTGRLAPGRDRADLLRAAFPGGSISGAPKVRALEIIEELEPVRRGVYCGAIGHLGFHGALDLNIAIRTAVVARGRFLLHSGGAVTADSDPGAEYEETLAKAEGFLRLIRATP